MDPLSDFPDDAIKINVKSRNIEGILDFSRFKRLRELDCVYNKITRLDNLPNCLIKLRCFQNKIKNLDNLPNHIIEYFLIF